MYFFLMGKECRYVKTDGTINQLENGNKIIKHLKQTLKHLYPTVIFVKIIPQYYKVFFSCRTYSISISSYL
jgi:hypothetical protein